jgi:TetR/AcrR family transcriptional regulator, regulator of cefoperazone and chloramphenicol sensitivity
MPDRRNPPAPDGAVADDTHARLLETAGRVFAEAGFQAAKVRDICARAGVNIAAVNYHFGDKLGLYRQVLRYAACAAGNVVSLDSRLPGGTPRAQLRAFVRGMLQNMYGEDRPAWPVRLMTHELAQPTPAFQGVVEQVIRPKHDAIRALVAGVIGRPPDDRQTRLCAQSIMGQIIVYAHGREVLKRLWPELKFTPETLDEIADHIAAFSYAALQGLAGQTRKYATGHAHNVRAAHAGPGKRAAK